MGIIILGTSGHSTLTGLMFFQKSDSPVCPLTVSVVSGVFLTSIGTMDLAGGFEVEVEAAVPATVSEIGCLTFGVVITVVEVFLEVRARSFDIG